MTSADYRYSKSTPDKQRDFEAAIDLHIAVTTAICRKWHVKQPYLYIDLHSGPGLDPTGLPGSPIVFLETAFWHQITHFAEFYELNPVNAEKLKQELDRRKLSNGQVICANHLWATMRHLETVTSQYGAVYVDPSNAEIPFDILLHLCKVYPKMDLIINLAFASYKRSVEHPDYVPLDESLPKLKRFWKVRKPIGKHQWSILIGTNWKDYPDQESWGFYDIDTPTGRSVYEKLVYTKRQLDIKSGQMPLWGNNE